MKTRWPFVVVCLFLVDGGAGARPGFSQTGKDLPRVTTLFDFDWRFHRGGAQGAEMPGFNDSAWRKVDLPHDWSIENIPGTNSPFDPDAVGQVSTGFTVGGTGWYRKRFTMAPVQKDKRIYLRFDGVYMNADVWLNGTHLGNHPYGYTGFQFDITDKLNGDGDNVIAVQVKNEGQNSRWYSGSGIYRHVWLLTVSGLHIPDGGIYITTPEVSSSAARVNIRTQVQNDGGEIVHASLITSFLDSRGRQVARAESNETIPAGGFVGVEQYAVITSPERWSLEKPILYRAVSELRVNGQKADQLSTPFGVRTLSFGPDSGFRLNDVPVELRGGCVHHDNGPLGARAYDRAEERKVQLMKANGYNAVRCAHNPPSPAFLDACDRLGMLVVDEAFDMWIYANNPYDYHLYFEKWWQRDIESMLRRDRNHPCIIMWSIGNEIKGMESPEVVKVAATLANFVREAEPTRPVTAAVNSVNEKKDPFFAALDVAGYNYARVQYEADHLRKPERIMFCSESFPLEAFEYWAQAKKHPWVIGDFVWTAIDYLGESSIGWRGYMQKSDFYPWTLAYCGDIDICGAKRPQSFYRDVLWNTTPQLSIFVTPPVPSFPLNPEREPWSLWHWHDAVSDWNWDGYEDNPLLVTAYSSCDSVELFLNGKSLGMRTTGVGDQYRATWNVPYHAGELRASGYSSGRQVKAATLATAGKPFRIKLTADTTVIAADGQSLVYVDAEILDKEGRLAPKADNLLRFSLTGPAKIEAVANSNPMSTESFQAPERKAWRGKCMVIIRSGRRPGEVKLEGGSSGLARDALLIDVVD